MFNYEISRPYLVLQEQPPQEFALVLNFCMPELCPVMIGIRPHELDTVRRA
jgi:hypothetical protein